MVNPSRDDGQLFRILIAGDSPEIRELLFEVFSSIGYAVSCAQDGLEALASLQAERYDLLITDYRMPRLDGLALLGCLDAGSNRPPSILITAQSAPNLAEEAKQAGATLVLFKPFAIPDLVALVEAIKDYPPAR
ncbi:MAG: response regulator [candidate division NC10 bacterium]|nr:response regulator [candidate division NC10 bacterium]MDE2322870.1 response regulator [candidate division NC10 bacterium]